MPQYAWVIPVGNKVTYCITVPVVSRVSHFVLYGVRSWYLPQKLSTEISCGEIIINLQNLTQPIPFAVVFAFVFASLV